MIFVAVRYRTKPRYVIDCQLCRAAPTEPLKNSPLIRIQALCPPPRLGGLNAPRTVGPGLRSLTIA